MALGTSLTKSARPVEGEESRHTANHEKSRRRGGGGGVEGAGDERRGGGRMVERGKKAVAERDGGTRNGRQGGMQAEGVEALCEEQCDTPVSGERERVDSQSTRCGGPSLALGPACPKATLAPFRTVSACTVQLPAAAQSASSACLVNGPVVGPGQQRASSGPQWPRWSQQETLKDAACHAVQSERFQHEAWHRTTARTRI